MKWITQWSGYAHRVHRVQLEGDELNWSHERIITAADRHGKCDDEAWNAIEAGEHPGHFGGTVTKHVGDGPDVFDVKIYTD